MKNYNLGFAVAGSIMTIVFLIIVNLITSSMYLWFFYPMFAILFWPIGVYCARKGRFELLSLLYSLLIIGFLVIENIVYSPEHPWSLYTILPILWWPILMYLKEYARTLTTAIIGSISIILYYTILNMAISPEFPWAIFPAFAVLWWPLSLYHARKKTFVAFSVSASLFISIFFIIVNAVTTPNDIWAVYPIFTILWWPLSMYYFVYKRKTTR
ncbi:hypothetical protein ACE38V_11650 [Cytobacillus sp. Hz8]|uniref:hypothetical protein n=1 Tax=Cytobacillus sp. Hz8 TaxID=3347168 RepID=UPI0035DF8195